MIAYGAKASNRLHHLAEKAQVRVSGNGVNYQHLPHLQLKLQEAVRRPVKTPSLKETGIFNVNIMFTMFGQLVNKRKKNCSDFD